MAPPAGTNPHRRAGHLPRLRGTRPGARPGSHLLRRHRHRQVRLGPQRRGSGLAARRRGRARRRRAAVRVPRPCGGRRGRASAGLRRGRRLEPPRTPRGGGGGRAQRVQLGRGRWHPGVRLRRQGLGHGRAVRAGGLRRRWRGLHRAPVAVVLERNNQLKKKANATAL